MSARLINTWCFFFSIWNEIRYTLLLSSFCLLSISIVSLVRKWKRIAAERNNETLFIVRDVYRDSHNIDNNKQNKINWRIHFMLQFRKHNSARSSISVELKRGREKKKQQWRIEEKTHLSVWSDFQTLLKCGVVRNEECAMCYSILHGTKSEMPWLLFHKPTYILHMVYRILLSRFGREKIPVNKQRCVDVIHYTSIHRTPAMPYVMICLMV